MALTAKQEAFAVAYFESGNAAEAYRKAYNVDENSRDRWHYVEAQQLLDHPVIALRIKEIREKAEELAIYTRHKAMEELEEARQLAQKVGQVAGAVGAIKEKVKLTGLDRPSRVEVTGKDGQPVALSLDPTKLSTAAMEELLHAFTDEGGSGSD
ncbi:MAG: terminase small subunit [Pseudomonadota bacterium]